MADCKGSWMCVNILRLEARHFAQRHIYQMNSHRWNEQRFRKKNDIHQEDTYKTRTLTRLTDKKCKYSHLQTGNAYFHTRKQEI